MAEKETEEAVKEEVVPEEAETFEDVWDENPEEEGGEEEPPTDEPGESEGEAKEEPKPDEPEKEEESPEEPAEEEPVKKDDAPAEEDADEKPSYEKLEQQHRTLKGMYNKAVKEIPQEDEEPDPKEEEAEETFTLDTESIAKEIEELPSFKAASEEHGEEVGAVLKDATGLIMEKVNGVLNTMSERVKGRFGEISDVVKPLQADHARTQEDAHESAIVGEHPDFMTYVNRGELKKWVQSQVGTRKKVLETIYADGSTKEIIDMVSEFRKEKGYEKAPEEIPEEEVDESKNKKLEDMEAIETKKRPVSPGKGKASKENFEDSWDEAD